MATKIKTKFFTSCCNCQHKLMVTVQSAITKDSTIVFTCSECKTANFLNGEEISNEQLL